MDKAFSETYDIIAGVDTVSRLSIVEILSQNLDVFSIVAPAEIEWKIMSDRVTFSQYSKLQSFN